MKKRIKFILIISIVIVVAVLIALPKVSSSGDETQIQKSTNTLLPVKAHIIKAEKLANNVITSGSIFS